MSPGRFDAATHLVVPGWGKQAALGIALCAAASGLGCAPINRQMDHWALQMKASTIAEHRLDWPRGAGLPYRSSEQLERLTRPYGLPEMQLAALIDHRLDDAALVQEELLFTSAIPLRFFESRVARAYVYRHGPLGERPVLLWVPGQHVTEDDFSSLTRFFQTVVDHGFDLVFFVPPYHLTRSPRGYESGDAFLATDFADHLSAFAQELSDLRALAAWLRARGVRELGAFGSSMGGTMVLKLVSWEPIFEFATAMQPVINWNAVLARPEMEPVRRRLAEQGVSDEDVRLVYQAIDPRVDAPKISPARISVFYGRYDLIAPEELVLSLTSSWGVQRVRSYARGHTMLTLGGRAYRNLGSDLADSLDMDLVALRWRRFFEGVLRR